MNKMVWIAGAILMALLPCSICAVANSVVLNHLQSGDDPVYFNLVRIESDFININQYECNYIVLFPNGTCECNTQMNGVKTSFLGYYSVDASRHKIRIQTKDRIPFYFISSDEYTFVDRNRIIITATLCGKVVRFEYKRLE